MQLRGYVWTGLEGVVFTARDLRSVLVQESLGCATSGLGSGGGSAPAKLAISRTADAHYPGSS